MAKDKDIEKIYSNKMSKIFNNCFKLIVNKRNLKNKKIVGILDSWIIELFKPLSKLFKDSKFIIVVKDPRATMLSNYNVKKIGLPILCRSLETEKDDRHNLLL